MQLLKLKNNKMMKLDDRDFNFLSKWKWKQHNQGYGCRTGWDSRNKKWLCILVHRLIMDVGSNKEIHHINGNKLDNRRANLQIIDSIEHRRKHIAPLIESAKRRQIYPDIKVCEKCGANYKPNPRKRKRQKTCSKNCAQLMRLDGVKKSKLNNN